jgi:hypothetical protein
MLTLSHLYLTPHNDILGSPSSFSFSSHLVSHILSPSPLAPPFFLNFRVCRVWNIRSHYTSSPSTCSVVQDVVVFKSPNLTKFRLANALFSRTSAGSRTNRVRGGGGFTTGNFIVQVELAAVEPVLVPYVADTHYSKHVCSTIANH